MIRPCPSCGVRNRIPAERLADTGNCGKCKATLAPVAEPIEADLETFDEIAQGARVPVIVDFWADWCGPCRMAAPAVQQTARDMAGRALVLKVDTEKHPELARRYGVTGIPNFLVLRGGRTVVQQAGLVGAEQMAAWLRQAGA